jgi:hypothetical protein
MKTINLKGISVPLSERELKNVRGGIVHHTLVPDDPPMADGGGGGSCAAYLPIGGANPGNIPWFPTGGLSGSYDLGSSSSVQTTTLYTIYRGISKAHALALVSGISGAKWCCDSCASASWY